MTKMVAFWAHYIIYKADWQIGSNECDAIPPQCEKQTERKCWHQVRQSGGESRPPCRSVAVGRQRASCWDTPLGWEDAGAESLRNRGEDCKTTEMTELRKRGGGEPASAEKVRRKAAWLYSSAWDRLELERTIIPASSAFPPPPRSAASSRTRALRYGTRVCLACWVNERSCPCYLNNRSTGGGRKALLIAAL